MSHDETKLSLVILAAGMGRRYGDVKQITGAGPHGEWLLQYAIHDAMHACGDHPTPLWISA